MTGDTVSLSLRTCTRVKHQSAKEKRGGFPGARPGVALAPSLSADRGRTTEGPPESCWWWWWGGGVGVVVVVVMRMGMLMQAPRERGAVITTLLQFSLRSAPVKLVIPNRTESRTPPQEDRRIKRGR